MRSSSIPGPKAPQPYSQYAQPQPDPSQEYENQYPGMDLDVMQMGDYLPKSPSAKPGAKQGPGARLKSQLTKTIQNPIKTSAEPKQDVYTGMGFGPAEPPSFDAAGSLDFSKQYGESLSDSAPQNLEQQYTPLSSSTNYPGTNAAIFGAFNAPNLVQVNPAAGMGLRSATTGLRASLRAAPWLEAAIGTGELLGLENTIRRETARMRAQGAGPEAIDRMRTRARGSVGEETMRGWDDSSWLGWKPLRAATMAFNPHSYATIWNAAGNTSRDNQDRVRGGTNQAYQVYRDKNYGDEGIRQHMTQDFLNQLAADTGDESLRGLSPEQLSSDLSLDDITRINQMMAQRSFENDSGSLSRFLRIPQQGRNEYNRGRWPQIAAKMPDHMSGPLSKYLSLQIPGEAKDIKRRSEASSNLREVLRDRYSGPDPISEQAADTHSDAIEALTKSRQNLRDTAGRVIVRA